MEPETRLISEAAALLAVGRLNDAEKTCRRALESGAPVAEGLDLLSRILRSANQIDGAIEALEQLIRLDESRARHHFELGVLRQRAGDVPGAMASYGCACRLDGRHALARHNLAVLYRDGGKLQRAVALLEDVLRIDPSLAISHRVLGTVHRRLWNFDAALAHLQRAQELAPDDMATGVELAELYEKRGEFNRMYQCLRPLVTTVHPPVRAVGMFAEISGEFDRQDEALSLLRQTLDRPRLARREQRLLHFSAGRLLDQLDRWDEAFGHFEQANAASDKPFDSAAHRRRITKSIETFTSARLSRLPHAQDKGRQLVFIVGMPRSGTTLVEQILASHQRVRAAGEMLLVQRMADSLSQQLDVDIPYPECVSALTCADADRLAAAYRAHVERQAGDATHVTDKMTFNFLHLGLIALLFPTAQVIYCTRHALDCCLSCYFNDLGPYNRFADDLRQLGDYYRQCGHLMSHWQRTLPLQIHTVRYERLVNRFEGEVRGLLAFCGLEWEEACLAFHKTKRIVVTASTQQVRRPIYRDSLEHWRPYERHLGPLIAALGDTGAASVRDGPADG